MMVEGRGKVAPAPVRITIDRADALILRARAFEQAARRRYRAHAANPWKRGLAAAVVDAHAGELPREVAGIYCGMLGEWATCLYLRRLVDPKISPDLMDRFGGDGGIDIQTRGLTIQVKTRTRSDLPSLVRRVMSWGSPVPIQSDAFVFCRWPGGLDVDLLGWAWTRDVLVMPIVPARKGEHFNAEIPDEALSPMSRLISEIRSRTTGG